MGWAVQPVLYLKKRPSNYLRVQQNGEAYHFSIKYVVKKPPCSFPCFQSLHRSGHRLNPQQPLALRHVLRLLAAGLVNYHMVVVLWFAHCAMSVTNSKTDGIGLDEFINSE